ARYGAKWCAGPAGPPPCAAATGAATTGATASTATSTATSTAVIREGQNDFVIVGIVGERRCEKSQIAGDTGEGSAAEPTGCGQDRVLGRSRVGAILRQHLHRGAGQVGLAC